ncbi:unnamed protein product [Caretta caretta]
MDSLAGSVVALGTEKQRLCQVLALYLKNFNQVPCHQMPCGQRRGIAELSPIKSLINLLFLYLKTRD